MLNSSTFSKSTCDFCNKNNESYGNSWNGIIVFHTDAIILRDTVENSISRSEWTYQQVELLQNENNRLRMESESLLKVIKLLSAQRINTHKDNDNTENFITIKETPKNKKIKLNHNRIPEFKWGIHLKFFPLKNVEENSMSP